MTEGSGFDQKITERVDRREFLIRVAKKVGIVSAASVLAACAPKENIGGKPELTITKDMPSSGEKVLTSEEIREQKLMSNTFQEGEGLIQVIERAHQNEKGEPALGIVNTYLDFGAVVEEISPDGNRNPSVHCVDKGAAVNLDLIQALGVGPHPGNGLVWGKSEWVSRYVKPDDDGHVSMSSQSQRINRADGGIDWVDRILATGGSLQQPVMFEQYNDGPWVSRVGFKPDGMNTEGLDINPEITDGTLAFNSPDSAVLYAMNHAKNSN